MAKATTTIRQCLNYQAHYAAYFAATQSLFNRVVAFYFAVIAAHEGVLDLPTKEALTALEKLTHVTKKNPSPVLPLTAIAEAIPAFFRRAAINAALGSARSPSMPPSAPPAPSLLLSRHGEDAKSSTKPSSPAKGKSSRHSASARRFPRVPGISRFPCTPGCGKSEQAPPSCSKCGLAPAGPG